MSACVVRLTLRRAIDTDAPPIYRYGQTRHKTFDHSFAVTHKAEAKRFPDAEAAHRWLKLNGFQCLFVSQKTGPKLEGFTCPGPFTKWEIIPA
jgi:hypothetical protein